MLVPPRDVSIVNQPDGNNLHVVVDSGSSLSLPAGGASGTGGTGGNGSDGIIVIEWVE